MRNSEQLVEAAKAGDADAVTELVQRYEHTLLVTVWAIVGDFHHAQDVAQESFVTAFRSLHQLRDPRAFGPWLLMAAKRNARRHRQKLPGDVSGMEMALIADSPATWQAELEEILPHIAALPEQERVVVSMRYFGGLSVKLIADETGRPIGTVTKQLSRAIDRLQNMLIEVDP